MLMIKKLKIFFFLDEEKFDLLCFSKKYPMDCIKSFFDYEDDIVSYHDLNILFIIGLEINREFVKDFYLFCKKNNLNINFIPYLKDEIEILFLNVNKKYDDIFLTFKKMNNHQVYNYCCLNKLDIFRCRNLILEIKNKYHYDDDFGKEKDNNFFNILDNINKQNSSIEEKTSQYLFYIINEKPFIKGNEEIACFLVLDFLNINRALQKEGKFLIEPSDLTYAAGLINNCTNKEEVLEKIKGLFVNNQKYNCNLGELLKENHSKEDIINYIVSYVENFYGYQGYYEYYNSSNGSLKIHYHGEYIYFKLNVGKSLLLNNTLYFDCVAIAYIEAPFTLVNRDNLISNLFEEIKTRSYEDVINKSLINKLKLYYDIKFNIKWKLDIDTDYIF